MVVRLQKVAKSCITVWVQKVQNDYARYLQDSSLQLKDRRETLAKFISGSTDLELSMQN